MTMFEGYDMSALLNNASKPMETFRAREAKRAELSKPKTVSYRSPAPKVPEHDIVQDYIKANVLDKQTDVFDQLLKEQNLTSLWEFLNHSEHHSPVIPLAKNRLLNFYEGATRGGLNRSDLKAGMIVCLMASTVLSDRDNISMEQATGPLGILYPYIKVNLRMPATASIDNLILLTAEKALGYLVRVSKPDGVKMNLDRLGTYLIDALRMWLISEDDDILAFMAKAGERMKYMKPHARNNFAVRQQLGAGDITAYRQEHLCDFVTPWAKGKCMMRNAAGTRARLMAGV